jgi:hypothetical protein
MIYRTLLILLLFCGTVLAEADTAYIWTQIIDASHDTLVNADVTFELYGVSSVIDTSGNVFVVSQTVSTKSDDSGYVYIRLLRNENMLKQKSGAVHPWTKVTISHSTLQTDAVMSIFIDADSTGAFSFGKNTNAVQFGAP